MFTLIIIIIMIAFPGRGCTKRIMSIFDSRVTTCPIWEWTNDTFRTRHGQSTTGALSHSTPRSLQVRPFNDDGKCYVYRGARISVDPESVPERCGVVILVFDRVASENPRNDKADSPSLLCRFPVPWPLRV
jgi:hypothetical protein